MSGKSRRKSDESRSITRDPNFRAPVAPGFRGRYPSRAASDLRLACVGHDNLMAALPAENRLPLWWQTVY
jgi:hypothetical protein